MISLKEFFNDKQFYFSFDPQNKRVIVEAGKTSIMCHVSISSSVISRSFSESGCKPLTVFFESRFNSINKIPGGFKKKDSISDSDIVLARLVDRCIRPLIPNDFNREIRVYLHVLSYSNYSLETLSVLAASLNLSLFGILDTPVSLCKLSGDEVNTSRRKDSKFRFMAAFSSSKWSSPDVGDNVMIDYELLRGLSVKNIDFYRNILDKSFEITSTIARDMNKMQERIILDVKSSLKFSSSENFSSAYPGFWAGFWFRMKAWKLARSFFRSLLNNSVPYPKLLKSFDVISSSDYVFNSYVRELLSSWFVEHVARYKRRLDSRLVFTHNNLPDSDVRESFVVNRLVNSAVTCNLFYRGNCTQIVSSVCVADSSNAQLVDSLDGRFSESFIVNYNFLPHLSDDHKRSSGCSRRELGHSDLIKKSLKSLISDDSKVIRIVSDVVACDGGSSMAAVCGGSILLYQNKLIPELVAGISIGMIKYSGETHFIVDLSHSEDEFLSSIDCKIAASKNAITAIQLDSKKLGLTYTDFDELIKVAIIKLKEIINSINASLDTNLLVENRSYKGGLTKGDLSVETFSGKTSGRTVVFLPINTAFFEDCLLRNNIEIVWLAKKLSVDIRIEGSNRLKLSAFKQQKLDEAIKFITHLMKK